MKIKLIHRFSLALLAIIFTIGLTFASVELPRIIDSFLQQQFNFSIMGDLYAQSCGFKNTR